MAMKIKSIYHKKVPIASAIRNAYIDFSKMDVSVVSIVSDVIRNGKPVTGYGFNSNGRYSQEGMLLERFIPRLMEAKPEALLCQECHRNVSASMMLPSRHPVREGKGPSHP